MPQQIQSAPPRLSRTALHNGDRMTQPEFHRAYALAPPALKAELIEGVVYVASPLSLPHGRIHALLTMIFGIYCGDSPGVEMANNATVILGEHSEPQPDLLLRVLPTYGGQSGTDDDQYIVGPPELVAEISHSTRAIDLHAKQADYARHGVREYLVVAVQEELVHWFDLTEPLELAVPRDGICRTRQFPGLWIDAHALFANDHERLLAGIYHGIESPDHAGFVRILAERQASTSG
jgi:Uma2 family endonuclease